MFVNLLQIKDKFHWQESIIIPGVSAHEESVNNGKIQSPFSKVSASTYERVSTYRNA